jgi:hypothetical protein
MNTLQLKVQILIESNCKLNFQKLHYMYDINFKVGLLGLVTTKKILKSQSFFFFTN